MKHRKVDRLRELARVKALKDFKDGTVPCDAAIIWTVEHRLGRGLAYPDQQLVLRAYYAARAMPFAQAKDTRQFATGYICKACETQMVWPALAMTSTPAICPACGWTWGHPV